MTYVTRTAESTKPVATTKIQRGLARLKELGRVSGPFPMGSDEQAAASYLRRITEWKAMRK